ncbi:MAG: hypothetical protein F9K17_02915 [Phycisphaerae bacterium]|nr:MAG: hypothetical protein F9K17_02915 [Phycisphaerae bacterium]
MSRNSPQPEPPHGYKLTDLGPIPDDWNITPLGQLIDSVEYGSSAKSNTKGAIPVLRMGNLQGGRIDWADLVYTDNTREISTYYLQAGDVLFNRTNTIDLVGKTALYGGERPAIFAGYLIRIKVAAELLDARFLNYILNTPFARRYSAKVVSLAVGQANINGQKLKTYPIPLPPTMEEQRAIADALSDVDGLLGALEKLIVKKRAIKQAAMQQLLTAKTRLPGFTGKWETTRLGDHVRYLTHGVNPRADLTAEGSVRYLHYGDVHAAPGPWLNPERVLMPRLPVEKCSGLDRLESGDLVLVDASEDLVGIGKSVELRNMNGVEAVAGLHTIAARFDKEILADGFKGYLQYIPTFKSHLEKLAAGTKVYATNRSHVSSAELPLPSIQEQSAIAAVLSDMDAELEALERRREKVRQIKLGMMQQLLTGCIRLLKPQVHVAQADGDSKGGKAHSWAFNEAVVIGTLAKHFAKEEFPLGRKRYTKLSYLLHRHAERRAEGYLKKAAGPYNPRTKYGGPERIGLESGYIREHKNGPYTGFVAGDNIAQAEAYFEKWYGPAAIQWLHQFRFKKNDDLEVLTTVDMAAEELRAGGRAVDVPSVKAVIRSHPEWQAKLDRPVFSDANIATAIDASCKLFGASGEPEQ